MRNLVSGIGQGILQYDSGCDHVLSYDKAWPHMEHGDTR